MLKNKDKYMVLFACCLPVKGAVRSLIVDTQRETFHFIPNDLYDLLMEDINMPMDQIYQMYGDDNDGTLDQYFHYLLEKEVVFFTDEPESFPKISTEWCTPRKISNAIIDFSSTSAFDHRKAIKELDQLGVEAIQFRIFDDQSSTWILDLLETATKLSNRLRVVELVIKHSSGIDYPSFEKELVAFPLLSSVVIHSAPQGKIKTEDATPIIYVTEEINDETHCGKISPISFASNIEHVLEAASFNSCLNRKVSIDKSGNIKNCPSLDKSFGHINSTAIAEVVSDASFQKTWIIDKSKISVCRDCEFRLICSDCRAYVAGDYDKPAKCNYDPYEASWKEETLDAIVDSE